MAAYPNIIVGSPTIIKEKRAIPIKGIKGTSGHLKLRGRQGK